MAPKSIPFGGTLAFILILSLPPAGIWGHESANDVVHKEINKSPPDLNILRVFHTTGLA